MGGSGRQVASLDGLRGLAVAAVVAYHFWPNALPGGFLGVDLFFVLSGYLITSLLLGEHASTGRIGLTAFWSRRARRLLPALFVLLIAVAAYSAWLAPRYQRPELRSEGLATLFYYANWAFIRTGTSYFTMVTGPSPLQHTWSLAIEEQFYVVWPIVVFLGLRLRRARGWLLGLCTVGAIGSAVAMGVMYDPRKDPSRIYFGTDTRVQTILIGALLAVLASSSGRPLQASRPERWGRLAQVVVAGGSALILGSWLFLRYSDPVLYRGGFALFAVTAASVVWGARYSGRATRLLEWTPLRKLGLASYGVYLYHWPILVILTPQRAHIHGVALTTLRLALLSAVTAVSYVFLERPIRTGRWGPAWSVRLVPPFAASCAALLLLSTTEPSVPASLDVGRRGQPAVEAPAAITALDRAGVRPMKVLLLPDSIAWSLGGGQLMATGMSPTYTSPFDPSKVQLFNASVADCDLQPGQPRYTKAAGQRSDSCDNYRSAWTHDIATFDPEVVLYQLGPFDMFDRLIGKKWVDFGTAADDAIITAELDRALSILTTHGARLVILTSGYYNTGWGWVVGTPAADWRVDHINALAREWVAKHAGRVSLIDIARRLCPTRTCVTRTPDGQDVRWDGAHYTLAGGRWMAAWLTPQLESMAPRRS